MRAVDYPYLNAPGPLALAHRGGAAYRPNHGLENTLAAFGRAVELGYRFLETDVHATSDGVVVAFHDSVLDRVSDSAGAVGELSWESVRGARVGGLEPIPLLSDVFEAFPGVGINIDIKSDAALAPTVALIREHEAFDRVCVGSFSERRIHTVRRLLGPRVATAAGRSGTALLRFTPQPVSRWLHSPAPVLQLPAYHRLSGRTITLVTGGLVERAHRLGKHVHVWFHDWAPQDATELHRLLDLGVDGLVTDHLEVLREVYLDRGLPWPPTGPAEVS